MTRKHTTERAMILTAPEHPVLLHDALQRIGCGELWSTGPGVDLRPELLPALLSPLLHGLQQELAYKHRLGRGPAVRLRVGVHVGPPASRAAVHRLLEAEPVRELLDRSNPEVTFVVAAITPSARALLGERAPELVTAETGKGLVHLHVPQPSGRLLALRAGR
ncbi:hypothetical protein BC739_005723 [Kutzneria viridogrisea]|uniref:Uncharacterized protein n=2 Tax=Kutzneria TaxID=43356 RepID=W5W692_9PSEU|nr:hypothetical protein [Kutzneria albida]AHH96280.1 hypothetical protein KALB_2912 [Kutzneria albida DSM 43870]MBA8928506.1 hypothetical protein [Kutzneria viridogrisea]